MLSLPRLLLVFISRHDSANWFWGMRSSFLLPCGVATIKNVAFKLSQQVIEQLVIHDDFGCIDVITR